jgi:hypothetical protein
MILNKDVNQLISPSIFRDMIFNIVIKVIYFTVNNIIPLLVELIFVKNIEFENIIVCKK